MKAYRVLLCMTGIVFATVGPAGRCGAQDPVVASFDDKGDVLLRQFMFPHDAVLPTTIGSNDKIIQPAPPDLTVREHHMYFKAEHLLVATMDGKRLSLEAWRPLLKKDTVVLYTGWVFIDPKQPITKDELEGVGPKIHPVARKAYRDDILVVFGLRMPFAQKGRLPASADAPKVRAPEFMEASIAEGGILRLRQEFVHECCMPVGAYGAGAEKAEVKQIMRSINTRELPSAVAKIYQDGKPAGLKPGQSLPAALVTSGKNIDPFYLRLLRSGTFVVVTPPIGSGHGDTISVGPATVPVPAPPPPPPPPGDTRPKA